MVSFLHGQNVGIGTAAPTHRLHIVGSIRIQDGTEGVGKVLKSDAQGVGRWAYEVPPGGIIMYSGPWNFDGTGLGTGPLEGWALCNGNNGTPNLTDRFVMGTSTSGNLGTTGGANSYTLTVAQLPPIPTLSPPMVATSMIYGLGFTDRIGRAVTTALGVFSTETIMRGLTAEILRGRSFLPLPLIRIIMEEPRVLRGVELL